MNKKSAIIIFTGVFIIAAVLIILNFVLKPRIYPYCDISKIEVSVSLERFDQEFYSLFEDFTIDDILDLQNRYNEFFDIYNHRIIRIGGIENHAYRNFVRTFLSDYAVTESYKAINEVFEDCSDLNDELSLAFRYFKCHFPDRNIPRIIAYNGGFNQSVVTTEGIVGVGLDKYLGEDNDLYDMLEIPGFAKREMNPERIPLDVVKAYALMEFPYYDSVDNLANRMIYNGMILFLLDACFPRYSDKYKIGYDDRQIAYCRTFEREMWSYLINEKLLFSTNHLTIRKFTENAPFTSDFGNESPARTGNWLGWQIVRSYMKNNKDISVYELLHMTNYQKILNQSGYHP